MVMVFKRKVNSVTVGLLQSVLVIHAVTQTVHSLPAPCAGSIRISATVNLEIFNIRNKNFRI